MPPDTQTFQFPPLWPQIQPEGWSAKNTFMENKVSIFPIHVSRIDKKFNLSIYQCKLEFPAIINGDQLGNCGRPHRTWGRLSSHLCVELHQLVCLFPPRRTWIKRTGGGEKKSRSSPYRKEARAALLRCCIGANWWDSAFPLIKCQWNSPAFFIRTKHHLLRRVTHLPFFHTI